MLEKLAVCLELYAIRVDVIAEEDNDDDVIATLAERDGVEDAIRAGVKLSTEQAATLRKADEKLIAQAHFLVARHPDVFTPDRQEAGPRSYWWWFLNEGPQVREEAERAA